MIAGELHIWFDRQAILDCLTRFARGMDRFDRALVLSAFHPGATCDYGPYVGGPDGLCDWNDAIRPTVACTHHHLTNHSCEVSGTVAHAETYRSTMRIVTTDRSGRRTAVTSTGSSGARTSGGSRRATA
jgi:hypothetical protein